MEWPITHCYIHCQSLPITHSRNTRFSLVTYYLLPMMTFVATIPYPRCSRYPLPITHDDYRSHYPWPTMILPITHDDYFTHYQLPMMTKVPITHYLPMMNTIPTIHCLIVVYPLPTTHYLWSKRYPLCPTKFFFHNYPSSNHLAAVLPRWLPRCCFGNNDSSRGPINVIFN